MPKSDTNVTDRRYSVAIVGAGPVGLELAAALKRRGIDFVHFDAGQVGHTMSWWAPGTRWFSSNDRIAIAGVPLNTADQHKATREEYLAYLRTVVQMFGLTVNAFEKVVDINPNGDGFTLSTDHRGISKTYRAENVVLAVGDTDYPREVEIPGADLPHVHRYFNDPHTYFDQDLLIVGGRNSAVEAALRCHHAGARVAISYRREFFPEKHIKYWLMPEIGGLIKGGRIDGFFQTTVAEITPTHVTLDRGGERFDVPADFVLMLIGYEMDRTLFGRAGIRMVGPEGRPEHDEATMQTNVPGLYVAGTAVAGTQSSKYHLFLENCHVHVDRIVAALTGGAAPEAVENVVVANQPES